MHLTIGRLLLQNTPQQQLEDNLFNIMSHFKVSYDLVTDPQDKLTLAQLFLTASERAKASSAYQPAYEYAMYGTKFLPDDPWNAVYDLNLKLNLQLAECEYIRGNYEAAEAKYPDILRHCRTLEDKTKVYMVQINQYEFQQRFAEILHTITHCLSLYGVT